MLDSVLDIETPEGVELNLRLAGAVPRALAYLIDLSIRFAVLATLSVPLALLGASGKGVMLIAMFLLEWLYPVFFEVFMRGATPGKRSIGLAVVELSGLPVGMQASLVRNLLRTVDVLPIGYGVGLASLLLTRHFQRLGDLAAGTVVVWQQEAEPPLELPAVPPLAPPVQLSLSEQKEMVELAVRLGRLSPERQLELAEIAAPLTRAHGSAGLQRLFGMACYIAGKR